MCYVFTVKKWLKNMGPIYVSFQPLQIPIFCQGTDFSSLLLGMYQSTAAAGDTETHLFVVVVHDRQTTKLCHLQIQER